MSDKDDLLKILESHGQHFLQSFDLSSGNKPTKRRSSLDVNSSKRTRLSDDCSDLGEEWKGIQDAGTNYSTESDNLGLESEEGDTEFEQEDDGFVADSSTVNDSKVVVFSEIRHQGQKPDPVSRAQMKAFMSSKVSKLRESDASMAQTKQSKTAEEDEEDRTNAENDALLHKLVHTKLLSGSLNPELDLKPAQRRKALAGRVLELTGDVKLGKGEKTVREAEKNKAAKRVREGLTRKQREREKQQLEEAKNLGNYHPTIKKLFDASSTSSFRKRLKGLGVGVGKFRGGVLQLSKSEIASVTTSPRITHGKQKRRRA